jgi:hypothetical protein
MSGELIIALAGAALAFLVLKLFGKVVKTIIKLALLGGALFYFGII